MQIIKWLCLLVLLISALATQAKECILLSKKNQSAQDNAIDIRVTGNYCIHENIQANEVQEFDIHAGSFKYQSPTGIGVLGSNIQLDLMQHQITSRSSKNYAQGIAITNQNNTIVKNGTLRVIGKQGVGVIHNNTSLLIKTPAENNKIRWCRLSYPECEEVSYLNSIDKLPPHIPRCQYHHR